MLIEVGASGPSDAKLMIVGEAPGADEVREKAPFVGAAGRLLTKYLAVNGIRREDCYVTNVVKCRPPGNNYHRLAERGVSERDYVDLLADEIRSVKPNCILALGSTAARVLSGHSAIGKWRGSVCTNRLVDGGPKVVIAPHPAAVLHPQDPEQDSIFANPGILEHVIAMDVGRAWRLSHEPSNPTVQPTLSFKPTLRQVEDYVTACLDLKRFSYDIETYPPSVIRCLGLAHSPDNAMCIPLRNGLSNAWSVDDERILWAILRRLFNAPGVQKFAQNENFDLSYLVPFVGYPLSPRFDTMLAHHLIATDLPHDLDFITSTYTYLGYYGLKGSVVKNSDLDVWRYNCYDCLATLDAGLQMIQELEEFGIADFFYGYIMPLSSCVFELQHRGIRVDLNKRRAMAEPLNAEVEALQQRINEIAKCDLNFASTKQLREYFYDSGRHKPKLHHKRKTVTTDKNALLKLAAKGDEVAQLVLEARTHSKMVATFLTAPVDANGFIHTEYGVSGTVSGRLNSKEPAVGGGTNLQNQPKSARVCYVPRAYMCFVKGDLSQAEARVVAWLTKGKMQEAFRRGDDVHQLTADLMGITRDLAKRINHAANYGMGPGMASMQLGVPIKEAKRLLELYHEVYPEVRQWHERVRQTLGDEHRVLTTCFGRRRTFLGRWDENLFRAAYSWEPQSTVADVTNFALLELWLRLERGWPLLQVHDELVLEVPLEYATRARALLHECLERPLMILGEELVIPCESKTCYKNWLS